MSYKRAIEMAGAKILALEEFGSYQGDWWAKVEYDGKQGWVNGSYGSCSGCDAFESEFAFSSHEFNEEYHDIYDDEFSNECPECEKIKLRMIEFGKEYLDFIMSQDEAEKQASENLDWDMDAKEMVDFIKRNSWQNIKKEK